MPTSRGVFRALWAVFLAVVCALWALHWVHLQADFPNDSPWMDYSKYTDEGWYGKAAIHQVLFGRWRVPGDLNTAVALPVWPVLEWVVFQVTGVTVDAARGLALMVFAGNLLLSYAVMRAARASRVAASGAVLLLAGSAFLWAFSRLAILEPLLTFWTLGSWLLALRLRPWQARKRLAALAGVGLLGCLAVLTKTTAIFLLPALAVLLCHAANWRPRRAFADLLIATFGGLVPWLAYYLLAIRPYSQDFYYFFHSNYWLRPSGLHDILLGYWWAAHGLLWVGPWLLCTTLVLMALAAALSPEFRRAPLVHASVLASLGLIAFTGWHNSPQPRYYMVLAYPVIFVAVLAVQMLTLRSRVLGWAAVAALAFLFAVDVRGSVGFARSPQYSLRTAARGITNYIDSHASGGNRILLSISGDEITLFTHLPAICDDFGADDLPTRIRRYRPGWYAEWNELDPGTLEDIHDAGYKLQPVAHWHAFDDEDRDDLILYRMVPVTRN